MRQLDSGFDGVRAIAGLATPNGGWIRTLREALGIGLDALAERLNVSSRSAVLALESSERKGTITVRRLRDAAEALECDLVLILVPHEPLAARSRRQARERARARLKRVSHTMRMEAQELSEADVDEMESRLAEEILRKGGTTLWG